MPQSIPERVILATPHAFNPGASGITRSPIAPTPSSTPAARLPLLISMSGIGMLLVVIGHAASAGNAAIADPRQLSTAHVLFESFVSWLQTFHMPLFFFISGYLLFHATLRSGHRPYYPSQLIAAKARRLLVPYLTISSAAYLPKVWLSQYALRPAQFSLDAFGNSLLFPWNNPIIFFWFLPTLFLMFCAAPWALRAAATDELDAWLLTTSAAASVITPHESELSLLAFLNLGGALHNFVYFALGFLACKRGWLTWFIAHRAAPLLAFALSAALFSYARENPVGQLCLALTGIGMVCAVASSRLAPAFLWIGRHSFEIYLFSWFPQALIKIAAQRLPLLGWAGAVTISIVAGMLAPIAIVQCLCALLPRSWHFVIGRDAAQLRPPVEPVVAEV